jgi:Lipid desaturase domain
MMKSRLLFAVFFSSLAFDLYFVGWRLDWRMIPAALVAWYLADLVSGLVHMYMDYRPCIPGTGLKELYFWHGSRETQEFHARQAEVYARISTFERIVYDFKKHHPMPDLLGRHGMLHLMKAPVFLVTLPISLILSLVIALTSPPGWLIVGIVVLLLGSSMTQAFHGSLHSQNVGGIVRVMRRFGLLMKPGAHKYHHDTLDRDFSVISGWSNPLVNFIVHSLLSAGVLRTEGLEPT